MAKITWLGEDHGDDQPGPSFTIWQGIKFPKDKPIEVDDDRIVAKARGNHFFEVSEGKHAEPSSEPHHRTVPRHRRAATDDD